LGVTITREQVIDHAMWLHGKGGQQLIVSQVKDYIFLADNLMLADFSDCEFNKCYFMEGGFRNCRFLGSYFVGCTLSSRTDFNGADFSGAVFNECKIDADLVRFIKDAAFIDCEFY
jgi:uncharacterized protein YjbI with pentapeptide repeats